jgi:uncharacterized SAM-binding protein YcdF (DUF218 family)
MMFALSKILWFLLAPFNLALFALTGAMIAMSRAHHKLARRLGVLAFALFIVFGVLPVGQVAVHYLETRYAAPDPMPARVAGVIVLGGALDTAQGRVHGAPQLLASADRINTFVALARKYPSAKLVYTGGIGDLSQKGVPEGGMIRDVLKDYGYFPAWRLSVEDQSRTTAENAALTKAMVNPKPGQTWLLVTSAWHMPRALGAFRAAGWDVVPVPADYLTGGDTHPDFLGNMTLSQLAAKEVLGIAAYALTGKWTSHVSQTPAP